MKELKKIFTTIIKPSPPFNFEASYKPSHFETPLEFYENGKYWFTMRFLNKVFGIKMWSIGSVNKPKVKMEIYSKSKLDAKEKRELLKELNWRFCFDENISDFIKLAKKNKIIKKTFENVYGMRECSLNSIYELLVISLVLQNTNVKRTRTMLRNLLEKYGTKVKFDNKELFVFFKPERIAKAREKELWGCKLGYRAPYIKSISQSFANKKIDELELKKMKKDEAKEKLMELKGIGPYSADIILAEALRYHGILVLDIWSQKIFSKVLFGDEKHSKEQILKKAEKLWGKWKGLVGRYVMEDLFWREHKK
jgi:3-methyladenine DNA glycosylase/8-oxoguanine DNA glycosylase